MLAELLLFVNADISEFLFSFAGQEWNITNSVHTTA